jgi:hypothetical protein
MDLNKPAGDTKMPKRSSNQTIGIILLIALVLLYVPIPFIDEKSISALALLCCGIYLLIKG